MSVCSEPSEDRSTLETDLTRTLRFDLGVELYGAAFDAVEHDLFIGGQGSLADA